MGLRRSLQQISVRREDMSFRSDCGRNFEHGLIEYAEVAHWGEQQCGECFQPTDEPYVAGSGHRLVPWRWLPVQFQRFLPSAPGHGTKYKSTFEF